MNFICNFPLFTIVFSLFSGPLCMMLRGRAAKYYTIIYECVLIILCGTVLWYTISSGQPFTYSMGEFSAPWGNEIRAGVLEGLTAFLFMIVMLCSVLGGWRFLSMDLDNSKINLYFTLINLMTAALLSLVWTNDIFSGYVFLEITTLTSCGILIVREIGRTTLAAVRYMILNLLGSGLFLLGVVLLYDITGHLLMMNMKAALTELAADPANIPVISLAVGILTIGLAIKSGLFPFHFWMPDTYGWATPTSASVLSSLVSKGYIFLLIKIYWRAVGLDVIRALPVSKILFVLGLCGMVFGSVSALRANNINLFHIYCHAVTKSLLFITTPRLAEVSGDSLLFSRLQGSGLRDPNSGIFFTVGSLSMVGIPIFAGFSSKLLFATAAVGTGSFRKVILVMLILAVSSLLNAFYFIHTVIRIYTVYGSDYLRVRERGHHSLDYNTAAVILTACNLFLGLFSWVITDLIQKGFLMFS